MTTMKIFKSICTAFLIIFCSCSINQTGLPALHSVKHFESSTNVRTEIEVWGIHISTQPIDGGVTIGYTRRNYIRPKTDTDVSGILFHSDLMGADQWLPVPALPATAPGANVLTDKSIGVSIRTNRHGLSADAGWRSTYLLEIDQDFEGIFYINIEKNDFEEEK